MARGWESKAVEGQIEASRAEAEANPLRISADQREVIRKREDLMLSRTRVVHDLEAAQNPRYRTILTAALAHLDEQLNRLTLN